MKQYWPYEPSKPKAIYGEVHRIEDGMILLNHIPFLNSIEIDGFKQTNSVSIQPGQFYCAYGEDLYYRESNCIVKFHERHNGQTVSVDYLQVGTIITANDMNEIKEHLENESLHGGGAALVPATKNTLGGVKVGDRLNINSQGVLSVPVANNESLGAVAAGSTMSIEDGVLDYYLPTASAKTLGGVKVGSSLNITAGVLNYSLPTASASTKGGVKIGNGLEMDGDTLNCAVEAVDASFFRDCGQIAGWALLNNQKTWSPDDLNEFTSPEKDFREQNGRPSQLGDLIYWYSSGSCIGYAYRTADKWVNLTESDGLTPTTFWANINPLLSVADRKKLDSLTNDVILSTTASTVEGAMWLSV